jgi:UDP-glucose 4-epimerase
MYAHRLRAPNAAKRNITDSKAMTALFEEYGFDAVFHFAASTHVGTRIATHPHDAR